MNSILKKFKITTKLTIGFCAVAVLIICLCLVSYFSFVSYSKANKLNIHTYDVLASLHGIAESMLNMETGQRGFSLTGDEKFLEPYIMGKSNFKQHYESAINLTSDNPKQQENLENILFNEQNWYAIAEKSISLRHETHINNAKLNAVIDMEKTSQGKIYMDTSRELIKNSETIVFRPGQIGRV